MSREGAAVASWPWLAAEVSICKWHVAYRISQEQEALAEDLRACRRKVLRLTNEKEYLLDRLLRYEDVGSSDGMLSSAHRGAVTSHL
jgi:hypothetical protein